jgi:hypothetical protein
MKIKDMLMKLYPTPESMLKDREKCNSWKQMGEMIGVTVYSLATHRRVLGIEKEIAGKKGKNFCDATCTQVEANIKELLQGESKNIVKRYKIAEPDLFYRDQRGYRGLEYIGTEEGSVWRQLSHNVSAI